MPWRPQPPTGPFIRVTRTAGDIERVVWFGIMNSMIPKGDTAEVRAATPDSLLVGMPMPYPPPAIDHATDPAAFEHWWRQLIYVFDLPDPSLFLPLPHPMSEDDLRTVRRFTQVTHRLASCQVMSSAGGFTVRPGDDHTEERINADFPADDLQAGFAAFLRQCDRPQENASYNRVRGIISGYAASTGGTDRVHVLRAWQRAIASLHHRSLDQLVRDAFVEREGWMAFAFTEEDPPDKLLEAFNYGDLLHWDPTRATSPDESDELVEANQRYAFLTAALGLAHAYIGFGELVRTAVTAST